MYKKFTIVTLSATLALLLLFGGVIWAFDPFLQYHQPLFSLSVDYQVERYQNAGIIKNWRYQNVVTGSSMTGNFRPSWFDQYFDGGTVKLTYPDAYVSELVRALTVCWEKQRIAKAFVGLDINMLIRSESGNTHVMPDYLYNDFLPDDVSYVLNKSVMFDYVTHTAKFNVDGRHIPFDEAFTWDQDYEWSQQKVLSSYNRPSAAETKADPHMYDQAVLENLSIFCDFAEKYPEIEFYVFSAPYSILYWDSRARIGDIEAILSANLLTINTLSQYPNVRFYYFNNMEEIVTDLDNYTDSVHYSKQISRDMVKWMAEGTGLATAADAAQQIDKMRDMVAAFDFEALVEKK